MKKFVFYLRVVIFILYLITVFLLINHLYNEQLIVNIYFLLNIIYSLLIILTLLSKKKIFRDSYSYNIVNIGIYIYTFVLYFVSKDATRIEIIKSEVYFRNNYIMLGLMLLGLIIYTLYVNHEEKNILNDDNKKRWINFEAAEKVYKDYCKERQ